jgi:hypothetical protein
MSKIIHHFNRVVDGIAFQDLARLSEKTQQKIAGKTAAVALATLATTFLGGLALCAASKFVGVAVMLASPVAAVAAGLYAISRFTEGYASNQAANLLNRAAQFFDLN